MHLWRQSPYSRHAVYNQHLLLTDMCPGSLCLNTAWILGSAVSFIAAHVLRGDLDYQGSKCHRQSKYSQTKLVGQASPRKCCQLLTAAELHLLNF